MAPTALQVSTLASLSSRARKHTNFAGVCVKTTACSSSGGTTSNNGCPSDPADVKCCAKPSCGASGSNCRWSSDCGGTSTTGQCPGPNAFKCCQSTASGFGGYPAPNTLVVGACKQVAVDGAKKIVAQFPGRVREIGCVRDCACGSNPSSDHCCGKATDMMCSDAGGVSFLLLLFLHAMSLR